MSTFRWKMMRIECVLPVHECFTSDILCQTCHLVPWRGMLFDGGNSIFFQLNQAHKWLRNIIIRASLANGKLRTISTASLRTCFDISTCIAHMSISFSIRNLCIQKCKYQHMWKVIYRNKTLRHAVFSGREDKNKKEILRIIKMRRKKRIA